jgi:hypothetical protein
MKLEFSEQIFKKYSSNSIKMRPLGAKLFHADGRTDGHYEAHSRFAQFWERT